MTRRCCRLLFLLFCSVRALSSASHFHQKPPELMWLWLCTTDESFLLFIDIWMKGTKWSNFLQFSKVVDDYRWGKVSRCSDSKMTDGERLCVRAFFFSNLVDFSVELYWKSFALKTGLGTRPLLPNPLNISILARHPMPACCWHIDWRTLACLPKIPCKQPTVFPCTPIFPFSHFRR